MALAQNISSISKLKFIDINTQHLRQHLSIKQIQHPGGALVNTASGHFLFSHHKIPFICNWSTPDQYLCKTDIVHQLGSGWIGSN